MADIIRPLNNNELLRDLLMNCDVITSLLAESTASVELEEMIIGALPANEMVPVTKDVFEIYKQSKKEMQSDKDNPKHQEKCDYLAKLLNIAAKQIITADLPDTADLFEQLYEHEIIKYDMLPEELRFNIQTKKLAGDVISQIDTFIDKAFKTSSFADMESLVVVFKRIIPELISMGEWSALNQIVKAICGFSSREELSSNKMELFSKGPPGFSPAGL